MTRYLTPAKAVAAAADVAASLPAAKTGFLPGCTPDGYVKSPSMGAYFQAKMPTANIDSVYLGSVCVERGLLEKRWFAAILFEDGSQYHYELQLERGVVVLTDRTTRSERIAAFTRGEKPGGGLGGYVEPLGLAPIVKPGGVYRIQLNKGPVVGYVHESFAQKEPFNDKVKARLNCAALAAEDALNRHRLFVQAEALAELAN